MALAIHYYVIQGVLALRFYFFCLFYRPIISLNPKKVVMGMSDVRAFAGHAICFSKPYFAATGSLAAS